MVMKKKYLTPILSVDSAQPANLLCESFNSNVGLDDGGGSDGDARAPETDWNMWGDE